jgi:hypothetical protein
MSEPKGGKYVCIYTQADQEAAISESTGAGVNVDADWTRKVVPNAVTR